MNSNPMSLGLYSVSSSGFLYSIKYIFSCNGQTAFAGTCADEKNIEEICTFGRMKLLHAGTGIFRFLNYFCIDIADHFVHSNIYKFID